MAECPALKALENTNEESGFQASVVMYFFMHNLWKFGESFTVLQFCSATIRPWEMEFCNRNQEFTPALRPARRAVWAVLCELCALCCSTWYLACVSSLWPSSIHTAMTAYSEYWWWGPESSFQRDHSISKVYASRLNTLLWPGPTVPSFFHGALTRLSSLIFPTATNLKTALIFLTSSPGLYFLQYLTAMLILESSLAGLTTVV